MAAADPIAEWFKHHYALLEAAGTLVTELGGAGPTEAGIPAHMLPPQQPQQLPAAAAKTGGARHGVGAQAAGKRRRQQQAAENGGDTGRCAQHVLFDAFAGNVRQVPRCAAGMLSFITGHLIACCRVFQAQEWA